MDIDKLKRACDLINEASRIFAGGPLDYYVRTLVECVDYARNNLAKFKVGDRVTLTEAPETKGTGWQSSSHFLVPGEPAIVRSVNMSGNGFWYAIEFDNESWIDHDGISHPRGTVVPIEEKNKHVYAFSERVLESMEVQQ